MNMIRATQISFSFPPTAICFLQSRKFGKTSSSSSPVCFCERETSNGSESEGDKQKQEILARIASLQTQKVRLTGYLDERSAYLTRFAEDASKELDQIGEGALKDLDEASARIMENLDGQMQAFEESSEVNMREIERNEKELENFEEQIDKDRNEGLFFKNLRKKREPTKNEAEVVKEEAQKLKELTKASAGSGNRKNVYLLLMALLGVAIADSVVSSSDFEWKRVIALVLIFLALLAQYVYELKLSLEIDKIDKKK